MSNRNYTQEELAAALASMGITDQTDVSRYGSGHINDTFKVETASGVRYILQRVNTDIFPPEMLKENVIRILSPRASGRWRSSAMKILGVFTRFWKGIGRSISSPIPPRRNLPQARSPNSRTTLPIFRRRVSAISSRNSMTR